MLGEFITRSLILLLGYGYPAFESYKIVEKRDVEKEELRFWIKYWILVGLLTACEKILDVFLASWFPMYDEMKLAFFVYLWYPKTKGTRYVYGKLVRPYVLKHETDIDRKVKQLWKFAIGYWKNCTELGSVKFSEMLQYLAAQFANFTGNSTQSKRRH